MKHSLLSANTLLTSDLAAVPVEAAFVRVPVAFDEYVVVRRVETHEGSDWGRAAQWSELKQSPGLP